jgi:hypothetical protein
MTRRSVFFLIVTTIMVSACGAPTSISVLVSTPILLSSPVPTQTTVPLETSVPLGDVKVYKDLQAEFALDYPAAWFADTAAPDVGESAVYTVSIFSWDRATYTPIPRDLNSLSEGMTKIDITVFNHDNRSLEEAVRQYIDQDCGTPVTILKEESWILNSGEQAVYVESQGTFGIVGTMITLLSDRLIYLTGYGDLKLFKSMALTLRPHAALSAETGRPITSSVQEIRSCMPD